MTIYTPQQLQKHLSVGRDTAYRIMKEYGFRIGDSARSPLRITEKGVESYVKVAREAARSGLDSVRK